MNNVDFDYYAEQGELLATIQPDGNCVYNWPVIKVNSLSWEPHCTDWDIWVAKLLAPFAPKDET